MAEIMMIAALLVVAHLILNGDYGPGPGIR